MSSTKPTIAELIAQITPENKHDYISVDSHDASHDRTHLFYRLSLACIIIGTIVQVIAIISRAQ
jgi:hypothetical protein